MDTKRISAPALLATSTPNQSQTRVGEFIPARHTIKLDKGLVCGHCKVGVLCAMQTEVTSGREFKCPHCGGFQWIEIKDAPDGVLQVFLWPNRRPMA